MSDNNNDLGAFLAGFVIGGLVGAATALILAPQSGEETRDQIASKSRDLRDSSGERIQHYRDMTGSRTQAYRERASGLIADTRERMQETGGRVQEQARIVLDSGKERATQVKNQVETYVRKGEETVEEAVAKSSAEETAE